MTIFSRNNNFYRAFFRLLFFIALQNVLLYAVNLVDTLMLGAFSQISLAGSSLANQIQFLLHMVVGGMVDGLMVLVSQYWGKKHLKPINHLLVSTICFGLPVIALFFIPSFFFSTKIISLFTLEIEVVSQGAMYLKILALSFPFFFLTNALISVERSMENPSFGMWLSLVTLTTNLIANTALIFGRFGFPSLGIKGAAIATLFSRIVEFSIALIYTFRKSSRLNINGTKERFSFDKSLHKDYMRIASPVMLSGFSWGIAMAIQAIILGRLGTDVITANAIASTVFQVCTVIAYGGASAAGIIIGKSIGEDNLSITKLYTKILQVLFLLIGLLTFFFIQLLRNPIILFFQNREQNFSTNALELTHHFIIILSLASIGTSYQVSCLTGIVRGGGNTKFVLYNDLIFMWGIVLPSAFIGSFFLNYPAPIIFMILKSDQILKCFVAAIYVNRYTWINKLTRN